MPRAASLLELSEEQVLFFRAGRSHLAGPGAATAGAAAAAILGAQSQQLGPALLALSQRTKGRPTADQLREQMFGEQRNLVRIWGQRDTVHIYRADADWHWVTAARSAWKPGGRQGAMPDARTLKKAQQILRKQEKPLKRSDIFDLVPSSLVREMEQRIGSKKEALRYAAGRLLWKLVLAGDACIGEKAGQEQTYPSRSSWFPKLKWPTPLPDAHDACTELTKRYLSLHGPATAADIAHFFGATTKNAASWLERIEAQIGLLNVRSPDRTDLVALKTDRNSLKRTPPSNLTDWSVRLLPMWDTLLMAHADKGWTVPDPQERKAIWKPSAVVAATVLARGRIVATWTHKKAGRVLKIEIQPLSLWRDRKHVGGLRREAKAIANHLGLKEAQVKII